MTIELTTEERNLLVNLIDQISIKASDPQGEMVWRLCQGLIAKLAVEQTNGHLAQPEKVS